MLLLCLVFATAVQMAAAQPLLDQYKQCFKDCHDSCQTEGHGNTFCEMKCDGDCMAKETAGTSIYNQNTLSVYIHICVRMSLFGTDVLHSTSASETLNR